MSSLSQAGRDLMRPLVQPSAQGRSILTKPSQLYMGSVSTALPPSPGCFLSPSEHPLLLGLKPGSQL